MAYQIQTVGPEDYDKVIAIRTDVYGGFDFLPSLYRDLIQHSACTGYVAVVDGEFVAFTLVMIIDGGKTLLSRASRVGKKYEGKGLIRQFKEDVFAMCSQGIEKYVATFGDVNEVFLQRAEADKSLYMTRDIFIYEWRDEIHPALNIPGNTCTVTKLLETEDIRAIFNDAETCGDLFPERVIVSFWVPLRVIESNIFLLQTGSTHVVGSFAPECSLLTCGITYQCERGVSCHIDVYGTDFQYLNEHIARNIKQCTDVFIKGSIYVLVYCHNTAKETVNDVMSKFCFKPMCPQPFHKLYMIEKPFHVGVEME